MTAIQILLVLNLAAYLASAAAARSLRAIPSPTLVRMGALYPPLLRRGQWFRLVTCQFLHLNLAHIAMNMIALWQVGPLLEARLGRGLFLGLYVASGIGASALSAVWRFGAPLLSDESLNAARGRALLGRRLVVSAGASGAICGLIGAVTAMAQLSGGPFGDALRDSMLQWIAILLVYGFIAHADNAAHLGGLFAGGALGAIVTLAGIRPSHVAIQGVPFGVETLIFLALVAGAFALAFGAREDSATVPDLINRGVALARAGDEHAAATAYRQAIALHPRSAVAHFDLALLLRRQGDLPGALRATDAAVRIDSGWARAVGMRNELANALGVRPGTAFAGGERDR